MKNTKELEELLSLAQKTLPNFRWEKSGKLCSVYGRSDYDVNIYLGHAGYLREDPLDQSVSLGLWWVVGVSGSSVVSRMCVGQETYFRTPQEALQSVVNILCSAGEEMLRLSSRKACEAPVIPKPPSRDLIWHKYNEFVWRAVLGPYVAQVLCPTNDGKLYKWSVYYVSNSGGEDLVEADLEIAQAKAMDALVERYNQTLANCVFPQAAS